LTNGTAILMPKLSNQSHIVFCLFVKSGRQDTFVTNVYTACIKETAGKVELTGAMGIETQDEALQRIPEKHRNIYEFLTEIPPFKNGQTVKSSVLQGGD
jgi:hypothetical protein